MNKHQCEYCIWYVSDERGCECPYIMRETACRKAKQEKHEQENKEETK